MSRSTLVISSPVRLISRDGSNLRSLSLETRRRGLFADLFAGFLTSSSSRIVAFCFSASATRKDLSDAIAFADGPSYRESLFSGELSTISASPIRSSDGVLSASFALNLLLASGR